MPRTWDDQAIATLEIPLADPPDHLNTFPPTITPIPIAPIYKSYFVYAPGREPAGYMDWLKRQEPEVVWDDVGHAPALKTSADWIKAGEVVFDAPSSSTVRATRKRRGSRIARGWKQTGTPVAKDGTLPFVRS